MLCRLLLVSVLLANFAMNKSTLIYVIVNAYLLVHFGHAQLTSTCDAATSTACVGRDQVSECTNQGGQLVPGGQTFSCDDVTEGTNLVCYGAALRIEQVCGNAPPPCTTVGTFAVTGRCRNFYSCTQDGNTFSQTIGKCNEGDEFNAMERQCTTTATAGCSVPIPTTVTSTIAPTTLKTTTLTTIPPTTTPIATTTTPIATTTTQTETTSLFTTISMTTTPSPSCTLFRRFADPTNCRFYLQCFFGRIRRIRCPFNLFFDSSSGFCRRNPRYKTPKAAFIAWLR
ncbi:hypothetical protein B566_EDAN015635 [Ephemera danica]|nr:hypothetical protein B566_EDAN015635 [Ephemera danica]